MKPINKLFYLASPYTHKSSRIRKEREIAVSKCAVVLKEQGLFIYCPIAETSALARNGGLTNTDWNYWRDSDLTMLSRCDELWICMLDGWKESKGVRGEIKFAVNNDIPLALVSSNGHVRMRVFEKQILKELGLKNKNELND